MRAIGFDTPGGPEVLREIEFPEPAVGHDQVRIRVAAATVNNGDLMMRRGGESSLRHPAPWVIGMEAAGVADAVGAAAAGRFKVGDSVTGFVVPTHPPGGAYAELAVTRADYVVHSPANVSVAEAATLPMNGLTASMMLEELRLPSPGTVAVIGAAGAVGGYAVQLAKADGHRVIADAAERDVDLVRALGADVVVARGDGVLAAIREAAEGDVDGLLHAAMPTLDAAAAVRAGGTVATAIGFPDPQQIATAQTRGVRLTMVDVGRRPAHDPAALLRRLVELTERGELTLRVAAEFKAADAPAAHRQLEAGGVRGRLVLRF